MHAESRKEELQHMLSDVLAKGSIDAKLAGSLRGRMQWFETLVQGRVANAAIKKLGDLAFTGKRTVYLDERDKSSLLLLRDRVLNAPPLCIERSSLETWFRQTGRVYWWGHHVTVGTFGTFFSCVASDVFMKACEYSLNPIYELELLPMLVALLVWRSLIKGCHVVFYGDNDAARASLIAGRGSTSVGEKILSSFVTYEFSLQLKVWFSRVPTSSNIADGPGRLDCELVEGLHSTLVEVPWDLVSSELDIG